MAVRSYQYAKYEDFFHEVIKNGDEFYVIEELLRHIKKEDEAIMDDNRHSKSVMKLIKTVNKDEQIAKILEDE